VRIRIGWVSLVEDVAVCSYFALAHLSANSLVDCDGEVAGCETNIGRCVSKAVDGFDKRHDCGGIKAGGTVTEPVLLYQFAKEEELRTNRLRVIRVLHLPDFIWFSYNVAETRRRCGSLTFLITFIVTIAT